MAHVGIPRALLYPTLGTLQTTFFSQLGADPVVSGPTTRITLEAGVQAASDLACLPVKVAMGHLAELRAAGCDAIYFPRWVSIEKACYICPKFMGLPDMARAAFRDLPPLLGGDAEGFRGGDAVSHTLMESARELGVGQHRARRALCEAARAHEARPPWRDARGLCPPDHGLHMPAPEGGLTVCVVGHPYAIYDPFTNMDILERLAGLGCTIVTCEMLDEADVARGLSGLGRELFWSFGRRVIGTVRSLTGTDSVNGVVHVSSFACGPGSFVGQLVQQRCSDTDTPLLELTLDEHTGEAGIATRVEAFTDMLGRRAPACV